MQADFYGVTQGNYRLCYLRNNMKSFHSLESNVRHAVTSGSKLFHLELLQRMRDIYSEPMMTEIISQQYFLHATHIIAHSLTHCAMTHCATNWTIT